MTGQTLHYEIPHELKKITRVTLGYAGKYVDWLLILPIVKPELAGIMAVSATPGLAYNTYQLIRNRRYTNPNNRAICLMYENPFLEYSNIVSGQKGLISKFFTERGIHVEFKHGAKKNDLREALEDERIQHIVVHGHGSGHHWSAKDGSVTTDDVDQWMKGLPLKNGYFIQHTCGDSDDAPLGRGVVANPENLLGYRKPLAQPELIGHHFKQNMGLESLLVYK